MIKVLQINTNRSRPAHDMALATAKEMGAKILVVSEPNRSAIRNRKDWIYDSEIDVALTILDSNIAVKRQGSGQGFSYVTTTQFTIFGCYCSPNRDITDLELTLEEIGIHMEFKERIIIVGDFNAKSPQWGMNTRR